MDKVLRDTLVQLHKDCFNDGNYADYFFEHRLNEEYAYVIEENGEPLSACYARIFTFNFNGKKVEIPFLTGVATSPLHRYKGLATKVVNKAVQDLKAKGFPFLMLHPFNHEFYRKLGFETINFVSDLTPTSVALENVEFRKMEKKDIPLVCNLYSTVAKREKCYLLRDENECEKLIGYSLENGGFGYLIYEYGVPKGYVWCEDGACVEAVAEREELLLGLGAKLPYKLTLMGGNREYSMAKPLSLKSLFECVPYLEEASGEVTFNTQGTNYSLKVENGRFSSLDVITESAYPLDEKTLIAISLGQGDKVENNIFKDIFPTYNLFAYEIY